MSIHLQWLQLETGHSEWDATISDHSQIFSTNKTQFRDKKEERKKSQVNRDIIAGNRFLLS